MFVLLMESLCGCVDCFFFLFQTMTTPKKAKYQLRNRTVLVSASAGGTGLSGTPVANVESSKEEAEDLASESMPQAMIEEQTEALTEEIRKLQVRENQVFDF